MSFTAVTWDETDFLTLYPQFQSKECGGEGILNTVQLEMLWQMATSIIGNTERNAAIPYDPEQGVHIRKIVLYALMCHLATMSLWGADGQPGAIQSASEGSVSASFAIPSIPTGGAVSQWYNQTLCGRTVWAMLRKYAVGGRYYGIEYYHPFG